MINHANICLSDTVNENARCHCWRSIKRGWICSRMKLLPEFLSSSKSMNNCCFTITVKFQIIFLPSFLSCWTVLKPCSMISTANIGQMYVILQSTAFRLDYFLPTKNPLNAWLSTYYVDNKLVIHVSFIIWLPNSKEVLLFFSDTQYLGFRGNILWSTAAQKDRSSLN